jgi:hypothetical protein
MPIAPPLELELTAFDAVADGDSVVAADTPEVKGTTVPEEAPEKAAVVVLGLGVADVSFGFRTLCGVGC